MDWKSRSIWTFKSEEGKALLAVGKTIEEPKGERDNRFGSVVSSDAKLDVIFYIKFTINGMKSPKQARGEPFCYYFFSVVPS